MVKTRSTNTDEESIAPLLAQVEALSLPALTLLCAKLSATLPLNREGARLAAALQAAQIPERRVKLVSYKESMPSAGDGEVNFTIKATFEITGMSGGGDVGEPKELEVRYNYYCESEPATSVSVSYGSATGSGYLSLGDRKGYSGSCSPDKFRQVMEQVALDLGMLEALSSQEEKDARAEMAAKYCADKINDYGFPRWTAAEESLIKVMELFVPEGGLHKSGWDMSFMHIVVTEIEEKEWCY